MEAGAATLTLSSTLQIHPPRLFTCTDRHKPTITTTNPRNRTMTFHQPTLFPQYGRLQVKCGHKSSHVVHAVGDDPKMNGDHEEEKICARATSGSTLEVLMSMADTITTEEALIRLNKATRSDSLINLVDLQEDARKLAFSVITDKAVEKLKRKYKYQEIKPDKTMAEETYNYGLVLVEMLIYQGNYDEANKVVQELDEVSPSKDDNNISHLQFGADSKLYMAVIGLIYMLEKEESASQFWKEYADKKSLGPPVKDGKQVTFGEFKEQIKKLRQNTEGKG